MYAANAVEKIIINKLKLNKVIKKIQINKQTNKFDRSCSVQTKKKYNKIYKKAKYFYIFPFLCFIKITFINIKSQTLHRTIMM